MLIKATSSNSCHWTNVASASSLATSTGASWWRAGNRVWCQLAPLATAVQAVDLLQLDMFNTLCFPPSSPASTLSGLISTFRSGHNCLTTKFWSKAELDATGYGGMRDGQVVRGRVRVLLVCVRVRRELRGGEGEGGSEGGEEGEG